MGRGGGEVAERWGDGGGGGEGGRSRLDLAARVRLDEDVLGLEIAMDQVEPMYEAKSVEALRGDAPQPGQGEVGLAARLAVVARELV